MKNLLCPSMMCANFANLEKEVEILNNTNIDIFHLDIMDGQFVPNFGMGLQDIKLICKKATKPCDVHLMINNPMPYIQNFIDIGIKIIYVHFESSNDISRILQLITKNGATAGLAINPSTSFETIKDVLSLVKYVLVMSVNPGFAGQKYLEFVNTKIKLLHKYKTEHNLNFNIMIDGGCSLELIPKLQNIGANGFILGSSALFMKNANYKNMIDKIKNL